MVNTCNNFVRDSAVFQTAIRANLAFFDGTPSIQEGSTCYPRFVIDMKATTILPAEWHFEVCVETFSFRIRILYVKMAKKVFPPPIMNPHNTSPGPRLGRI